MKTVMQPLWHFQSVPLWARLALGSFALVTPLSQAALAADTEISTSVGPQTWTSDDFTVTNAGTVTGTNVNAIDVTAPGGGTLTNRGTITTSGVGYSVATFGTFGNLINSGTISGESVALLIEDPNGASITNEAGGVIDADIGVYYEGTAISVLTNAGLISGIYAGLGSSDTSTPGGSGLRGSIGELDNSGTIYGDQYGIIGGNIIETLNNSGTISSAGVAIFITQFGSLTNDVGGVISGVTAIHQSDFDTLINRGDILGVTTGISTVNLGRSRTLLQNDGTISGHTAVELRNHVGTLLNNGTISSDDRVLVVNTGGLDNLINNGLIRGQIFIEGSANYPAAGPEVLVGNFVNTGTIEGDIRARFNATLTINGGTDKRGVLTGLNGAQGLIRTNFGLPDLPIYVLYNAVNQDLTFGSGLLLLNDVIDSGDAHVRFAGANVQVNNEVAVTGNVVLSAGEMVFGVTAPGTYGHYTVTGTAALDAGTVSLVSLGTPVFAPGQSYHVLSADSVTAGSITTSIAGYDTSYSILDMGGTYDFVVSIDGLDATYNQIGFTAAQMLLNGAGPVISTVADHQNEQTAAAFGASGVAAGSDAAQGLLWGKILRAGTDRETNSTSVGYGAKSTGIVVGADMPLGSALNTGLALSWLRDIGNSADRINGTDATIDSYQVTAYGTWQPADRLRLDGQLAYGLARVGQHRYVSVLGAVADADYDGDQIIADLAASYVMSLGTSASLTPYAGLRAVRVSADSYREQGAGIANLSVSDFSATSLRHDIGVKLATSMGVGSSTVTPSLRLGWLHDYRDAPLTTSGTFGVTAFSQSSDRVARDGLGVGLGVELAANDSLSVGLAYDGEYRSDYQSHTGSIKASLRF